jgi:perosamine synthetase
MYKSIIRFIREVFEEKEGPIPLHAPTFIGSEKRYVTECVETTYVSSVGKFVDRLEEEVTTYTGAAAAVACVNGTNALHLALLLVGVQREEEVIMQPLTFIATANAISYCGAHPVFIDVDRDTMGLSPIKMEAWLDRNTELREDGCYNRHTGRRIGACVPMHTFGHPVRLDELEKVCARYRIALIEDAAESLGSYFKGRHTGTFGQVGVLSFNGNKTITTGGGGMLLFRDTGMARHAKHLTTQAKLPHRWAFVHDEIGYNLRMPNINAALGCAQMENLSLFVENKRELAVIYREFFDREGIPFFTEPPDCRSNYWLNTLFFENRKEKDEFLEYSNDHGVMSRPVWQLMNRLPMFAGCQQGDLSNAEWFEERAVNIPSSVRLRR